MSNPQNTSQQQKIQEILNILERFNFKHFGNDEQGQPLVIGPNGQVVPFGVAYKFLQNQLNNANQSQASGPENISMPNIPANFEAQMEKMSDSLDKNLEQQPNNEQKSEQQNNQVSSSTTPAVQAVAPKINTEVKPDHYGDGYSKFKSIDLDLTLPENIIKLENFIEKNAKKDHNNPVRWLSYMFQKAVLELKEENDAA